MPVVNKSASSLPEPLSAKPAHRDARIEHGVLRTSCHAVAFDATDSIGSTYEVARIPSHARLHRNSAIRTTGIAGATDVDLGNAETATGVNGLGDAITLATAGDKEVLKGVGIADAWKPIWTLLGYTRDPKKEISLYLTLNTALTGGGTAIADLVYIVE